MATRNRDIAYALRMRNRSQAEIRAFASQIRGLTRQIQTSLGSLSRTRNPLAGPTQQMQTSLRSVATTANRMATQINSAQSRINRAGNAASANAKQIASSYKAFAQNAQKAATEAVASHGKIVSSFNALKKTLSQPIIQKIKTQYQTGTPATSAARGSNSGAGQSARRRANSPPRQPQSPVDLNGDAMNAIGNLVSAGTVALAIDQIREFADTWTLVSNKIASAGTPLADVERRMKDIADVARETRNSLADVGGTFSRLTIASEEVGASQDQVLKVTETLSKAMTITGATTQEAQAALIQFAQALASGVLQGDELRSIRENAPMVARAIAEEFGVSIGQLKNLGAEGKLTSDRVFKAILSAADEVKAAFDKTTPTVTGALTNLTTSVTQFIGETDKAFGVTRRLVGAIEGVSNAFKNGDRWLKVIIAGFGTFAAIIAGGALLAILTAIGVALGGPLLLGAAAVGGVAAAFVALENVMIDVGGRVSSVSSYIEAFVTVSSQYAIEAARAVATYMGDINKAQAEMYAAQKKDDKSAWQAFKDGWREAVSYVQGIIQYLKDGMSNLFSEMVDKFARDIETLIGAIAGIYNKAVSVVGGTEIKGPDLSAYMLSEADNKRIAENRAKGLNGYVDRAREEFDKLDEERSKRAAQLREQINTPTGDSFFGRVDKLAADLQLAKDRAEGVRRALEYDRTHRTKEDRDAEAEIKLKTPQTDDASGAKKHASELARLADMVTTYQNSMSQQVATFGLVGDELERYTSVMEFKNRLDKMDALTTEERQRALNDYNAALVAHLDTMRRLQTSEAGSAQAAREYVASAGNAFENAKTFMSNTLSSLEDNLTDFLATGKLGWREMIQSMVADFMRLYVIRPMLAKVMEGFGLAPQPTGSLGVPQVAATAAAAANTANAAAPGATVSQAAQAQTVAQIASKSDIVADVIAAKNAGGNGLDFVGNYKPGVDPRLTNILDDAAKSYEAQTGYKVEAMSGFRPGDPRFHGKGMATDVRIRDQQGRVLDNYQDPTTFRAYEQYAQQAKLSQERMYPELGQDLRWGGYFSGPNGKYGAMDSMHFDLAGRRAGMGGGSWENGLNSTQRAYFPGAESVGMARQSVADWQKNPIAKSDPQQIAALNQLNQTQMRQTQQMVTANSQQIAQGAQQTQQLTQQTTLGQQQVTATQQVVQATQSRPASTPGTPGVSAAPGTGTAPAAGVQAPNILGGLQSMFSSLTSGIGGVLQSILSMFSGAGGGLFSMIGSIFGGFHRGGIVGSAGRNAGSIHRTATTLQKYHSGGIVGPKLGRGERQIIAKDNEAVMPTVRLPDGSFGVKAVGAGGGGGGGSLTFAPSTVISIQGGGGSAESNQQMADVVSRRVNEEIETKFYELAAKHMKPGGMLWQGKK